MHFKVTFLCKKAISQTYGIYLLIIQTKKCTTYINNILYIVSLYIYIYIYVVNWLV